MSAEGNESKFLVIKPKRNGNLDKVNDKACLDDLKQREYLDDLKEDDTLDDVKKRACLDHCFSTAGPRPGTGTWHEFYRVARGYPGNCHFNFLSNFHE